MKWRACVVLCVLLVAQLGFHIGTASTFSTIGKVPTPVLIELFVMSRCPDAQHTERVFYEVMERIHKLARLELHFIADARGPEVICKHGPHECVGNKQQLCVQDKSPGAENWQSSLPFVKCMNAAPAEIGKLTLAEHCLSNLTSKTLAEEARSCMTGWEGEGLLRRDAEYTANVGANVSATIHVSGRPRCVYDRAHWYDCPGGSDVEDFVQTVCSEWFEHNGDWPAECGDPSLHAI